MVRKIDIEWTDDLTGEPATSTVYFGFCGTWFEIDLATAKPSNWQTCCGRGAFTDAQRPGG